MENKKSVTFTIKRRPNDPAFVLGHFGLRIEDIEQYQNPKGYINFDILNGKEGGFYVKVNEYGVTVGNEEEIPF